MTKDPLNILVIDDEVLIQKIFSLVAKDRGHNVKVASDGVKGLKDWEEFNPDLVFLDVLMPNMDGFTVLKKKPKNSQAKIIMMSAHDDLDDEKIKQTKVDLFIKKPFTDIYALMEQGENLALKDQKE